MNTTEAAVRARRWWERIADVSYLPLPPCETETLLAGWLIRLYAALTAQQFDASVGAQIGAELVRANLTDPAVLSRSSVELAGMVADDDSPERTGRFAALLGEFARGYTTELLETRRRSQELLQEAMVEAQQQVEQRFRAVFDNAAIAIAVLDIDGTLVDGNLRLAAMFGIDPTVVRGMSMVDRIHPEDRTTVEHLIRTDMLGKQRSGVRFDARYVDGRGRIGWADWGLTLIPSAGRRDAYLLAVGEDTTERRALQAELHRQARHDPLTGLPNRRLMTENIRELIVNANPGDQVGLCIADLDGFKLVNDRYGHREGDRLLTVLAARLEANLESCGTSVARLGGDEFVAVVPPPADDRRVEAVAEAMMDALTTSITIGDRTIRTSASVGAMVMAADGADADALVEAADSSLYRAKADGKARWVRGGPLS